MHEGAASPRFIPVGFTPTAEQRLIQLQTKPRVLVMANAGAAKSTTLALCVAERLARKLAPESILALSFSQEAARVLKYYLEQIGVARALARRVRVQTFSDFALETLALAEAGAVPVLNRFEQIAPHVREAVAVLQTRNVEAAHPRELALPEHNSQIAEFLKVARRLKAELVDAEETEESLDELAERLNLPREILLLYRQLERLRKPYDCAWRSADDAVFDLVQCYRQGGLPAMLRPQFALIVVDELQDLNPAAYALIEHLLEGQRCDFTGAGDFDQVIHGWAGASVDFVRSVVGSGWQGLARLPLTQSFRHGPTMALAVGFQKHKEVLSGRAAPAVIQLRETPSGQVADVVAQVLRAVRDWRKLGRRSDQQAVILRAEHQSAPIENALLAEGIGYTCAGFTSYLLRPEILVLRAVVAYALDLHQSIPAENVRCLALEALLLWQEFRWGSARQSDMRTAAQHASSWRAFFEGHLLRPRSEADNAEAMLSEAQVSLRHEQQMLKMASLRRTGRAAEAEQVLADLESAAQNHAETATERAARLRLARTLAYLQEAGGEPPAHTLLEHVVLSLELPSVARRIFIDPLNADIALRSINSFVAMAKASGLSLSAFANWLQQQESQLARLGKSKEIVLSTVDAAKGQEFESVVIPFLKHGEFPLTGVDLQEESNRFYVAITRMRDELTLIADQPQSHPFVHAMRIEAAKTKGKGILDNLCGFAPAPDLADKDH